MNLKASWGLAVVTLSVLTAGCEPGPAAEPPLPGLPAEAKLTKNYIGAPEGQELPVTFGPRRFDNEAEKRAYIERGNIFMAAKTNTEIEMRLAVRQSNSIEEAEAKLDQMIERPTGTAATLPRFVLEQLTAFELITARLGTTNDSPEALASLARWVETMQKNQNGSVIQMASALDKLKGVWTPEQVRSAAADFVEAHAAYGQCEGCLAKSGEPTALAPDAPMTGILQNHQAEVDGALARLRIL